MDDFGFEASVWATPSTQDSSSSSKNDPGSSTFSVPSPSESDRQFADDAFGEDDDFEFSDPVAGNVADGGDDFDDFGDFGDGENDTSAFASAEPASFAIQSFEDSSGFLNWVPLRLDPLPPRTELRQGIGDILRPFWESSDCSRYLTDENIRQVGGLGQILVTQERWVLWSASRG